MISCLYPLLVLLTLTLNEIVVVQSLYQCENDARYDSYNKAEMLGASMLQDPNALQAQQTPCRNKDKNKEQKKGLWWTLPIPQMDLEEPVEAKPEVKTDQADAKFQQQQYSCQQCGQADNYCQIGESYGDPVQQQIMQQQMMDQHLKTQKQKLQQQQQQQQQHLQQQKLQQQIMQQQKLQQQQQKQLKQQQLQQQQQMQQQQQQYQQYQRQYDQYQQNYQYQQQQPQVMQYQQHTQQAGQHQQSHQQSNSVQNKSTQVVGAAAAAAVARTTAKTAVSTGRAVAALSSSKQMQGSSTIASAGKEKSKPVMMQKPAVQQQAGQSHHHHHSQLHQQQMGPQKNYMVVSSRDNANPIITNKVKATIKSPNNVARAQVNHQRIGNRTKTLFGRMDSLNLQGQQPFNEDLTPQLYSNEPYSPNLSEQSSQQQYQDYKPDETIMGKAASGNLLNTEMIGNFANRETELGGGNIVGEEVGFELSQHNQQFNRFEPRLVQDHQGKMGAWTSLLGDDREKRNPDTYLMDSLVVS